jgi:hypothetical protein
MEIKLNKKNHQHMMIFNTKIPTKQITIVLADAVRYLYLMSKILIIELENSKN